MRRWWILFASVRRELAAALRRFCHNRFGMRPLMMANFLVFLNDHESTKACICSVFGHFFLLAEKTRI